MSDLLSEIYIEILDDRQRFASVATDWLTAVLRANRMPGLKVCSSWWRHQMETFSALLALCAGNSPVNSPHKGQWRGAFMYSLICAWINGWVNNREAGDLRRHHAHYDVIVMLTRILTRKSLNNPGSSDGNVNLEKMGKSGTEFIMNWLYRQIQSAITGAYILGYIECEFLVRTWPSTEIPT